MEIISFVKDVAQNIAEHVATYRLGQSALRQLDKALWVVEKCARWAVPPPLDQDERPQPELVRPLPWVFFLAMLVALRVTRESISLINLVFGKPPVRSADVVTYIQSKRRYLRTLKYQGNRVIRSRPPQEPWHTGLRSLLEFTMCFRRSNYGNNNTLRASNNEQVLVVKRSKRGREAASPVASTSENTMERLIEKMMVDLDAESDDDSSFTLTNATSVRSERSEESESDADTLENHNHTITPENSQNGALEGTKVESNNGFAKGNGDSLVPNASSAPEKEAETNIGTVNSNVNSSVPNASSTPEKDQHCEANLLKNGEEPETDKAINDNTELAEVNNYNDNAKEETKENTNHEDAIYNSCSLKSASPKEDSKKFIQSEKCSPQKKTSKIANGRAMTAPNKRRGASRREETTNESL